MASSNSDADIKLKATLDSSEVTTGLQKIGQDASISDKSNISLPLL